MEPLAALGLAGNVIAFVDFLWTVLSEAREIYKSPAGETEESRFIEMLIADINRQNQNLMDRQETTDESRALLRESRAIADQVISGASMIKQKNRSRWKSFLSALKDVWGKDKTEALMTRLGRLQSQVTTHLLRTTM
jgi:hypothetical protein